MTRTGEMLLQFLDWLESIDREDPEYADLDKQGLVNKYLRQNSAIPQDIGA
jgi:hypothetical protein